jgi:hypothetical protein
MGPLPASGTATSGGTGSSPVPALPPTPEATSPPEVALPVPVLPPPTAIGADPEHDPVVMGWQTNPSPQSASALQGSSHRYAHWLTVDSEQVGGSTGVGMHSVFGAHRTGIAVPPVHCVVVWEWQTIPSLHSASMAQGWAKRGLARNKVAGRTETEIRFLVVFIESPLCIEGSSRRRSILRASCSAGACHRFLADFRRRSERPIRILMIGNGKPEEPTSAWPVEGDTIDAGIGRSPRICGCAGPLLK